MHKATIKTIVAMVEQLEESTGYGCDDYAVGHSDGYYCAIACVLSSLKDLLKEKTFSKKRSTSKCP